MAESYKVSLTITVQRESDNFALVDEQIYFNTQTFAKMANLADKFYELITALQKIK